MNKTITPFGKMIRKLRIEGEIHMKHMAEALKVSIAQLSAIETGRRKITDSYVENVIKYFKDMNLDTEGLREAADQSRDNVMINLVGSDMASKQLVSSFARRFPDMSVEEKEKLARLLNTQFS